MSPGIPSTAKLTLWMAYDQLNWFRIHLLAFIIVPFMFSGFMVAANPSKTSGEQVTQYIDILFMSFSAMTRYVMPSLQATSQYSNFTEQPVVYEALSDVRPFQKCSPRKGDPLPLSNLAIRSSSSDPQRRPIYRAAVDRHFPRSSNESSSGVHYSRRHRNRQYPGALGYEERENLRRKARVRWDEGARNMNESLSRQPTFSAIPHASSGRAAHSGRGGFPGLPTLLAYLFHALPSPYTRKVYSLISCDQQVPTLKWAHPVQSVEQVIRGPLENHRDAAEAKHAERVRWLPPGVRGVVVGRNSQIYDEELDDDDLEMFAAIEYKALKALPAFLRVELWIISKFVTPGSELDVLVHFLLTHSRRMFIYLFPSYQTWWLVFIQSVLILAGLLGYLVFNIGLSFYREYSGWQNFSDGLFQSISIRAAGFDIFELENLAPALQFVEHCQMGFSAN
ncbi:hypothetical protein QFC19_006476 [Naganishia cerealis]|uniref:Uncharacterized protein n=1 Tax=Naganishia cerealis TaxID=610337 RepID=A0ACC2VGT0_9TREE|nr:hypothetical protein QFC19_006476 [Naganishia cerealis]